MTAIFGQFGDIQAGLTDNGFFNWFNLTVSEDDEVEAGETVYRPTGDSFRAYVTLVSRAGPTGELQSLTLKVERSFIDGPQGSFARDIIKSFLGAVSGPEDAALEPTITEIQFRDAPGPVLMRGRPPTFSGIGSPAFRVMTGAKLDTRIDLKRVRLALANDLAGKPRFVVRAEPSAVPGKSWLASLLGR